MSDSGSGSRLPTLMLVVAGLSTLVAVLVSTMSILLQLRSYRKPALQRMVVRIMVMVPLYAISSLISLFSIRMAFFIDLIRDIYEAFVIYCFFVLLLSYLGGERSLLILLHGRPPKEPVFPVNLVKHEMDVSDPYTFLFFKRGILQYVQIKPLLAITTLILKAVGKYNDGDFRANSGYLYISVIYNISICLALYCLAMFWVCVNEDLKPFRPVPKFLCVKGILFFSFWQSVLISVLVAARVITKLGPYTDPENVSVGINDLLICIEMPFFAIAHNYAFSYKDFVDPNHAFVARMPMYYAFRDAFGLKDVLEDSKATLRGEKMDYREFEPAEGFMHQGVGRDNRIRAGLRYSKGGQKKYWLPLPTQETRPPGTAERLANKAIKGVLGDNQAEEVSAPLLPNEAANVVHLAPDLRGEDEQEDNIFDYTGPQAGPSSNGGLRAALGYELPFGDPDDADDELFQQSRQYLFGDYNYPCVDVSTEAAREVIWDEEERVLRDERGAWFSPIRGAKGQQALSSRRQQDGFSWEGYGAVADSSKRNGKGGPVNGNGKRFHDPGMDRRDSRESVIDREHDRTSQPVERNDVALRWANQKPIVVQHRGASRTQSNTKSQVNSSPTPIPPRLKTSTSKASTSSSRSGSASPVISRRQSRTHSVNGAPSLPNDAVDLVVEDPRAAEEEMARERKRGEVAAVSGPGLRKVYRRPSLDEGGRDVEEDEEENAKVEGSGLGFQTKPDAPVGVRSSHIQSQSKAKSNSGDALEGVGMSKEGEIRQAEREGTATIARVATPPPHAAALDSPHSQGPGHGYEQQNRTSTPNRTPYSWNGLDEEDNPWA